MRSNAIPILRRNIALLFMGVLFHLFLLFPLRNSKILFNEQGLFSWDLKTLILTYLIAIFTLYVLPWLISIKKLQFSGEVTHIFTITTSCVALLPLPIYLLATSTNALVALTGIAACLLQAYRLMSGAAPLSDYSASRRIELEDNEYEELDDVTPNEHLIQRLALLGLFAMGYYMASDRIISTLHNLIIWIYTATALIFSMVECEKLPFKRESIFRRIEQKHPGTIGTGVILRIQLLRNATYLLTALFAIILAFCLAVPQLLTIAFVLALLRQVIVQLWFAFSLKRHPFQATHLIENSGRLLIACFITLIIIGTALLSLPFASANGQAIDMIDAFFTATSASCVTGMEVLSTSQAFSTAGQIIICILFQIGGLGIMTISFFVACMLNKSIGILGNSVMQEVTGEDRNREAKHLLKTIIAGTALIELTGAMVLSPFYYYHEHCDFWTSLGKGFFLSISSFCNAGFSPEADSLCSFMHSPLPLLTTAILIMLGGLGFTVLITIVNALFKPNLQSQWRVHTRLVLTMTIAIWVLGTILFMLCDQKSSLEGMSGTDKFVNAFFQVVSSRTAGFNTLDHTQMSQANKVVTMVLMFIGGAPGSTGGGVKVTTIGIFLILLKCWLTGQTKPVYCGRRIQDSALIQAGILILAYLGLIAFSTFLLAIFTPNQPLNRLFFEATSATTTVGLTHNVTPFLTNSGKCVLMALMFIGRIGPLTFLFSFIPQHISKARHSETKILIG